MIARAVGTTILILCLVVAVIFALVTLTRDERNHRERKAALETQFLFKNVMVGDARGVVVGVEYTGEKLIVAIGGQDRAIPPEIVTICSPPVEAP